MASAFRRKDEPTDWQVVRELNTGNLGPSYLAERTDGSSHERGVLRFLPASSAVDEDALRMRPDWRALSALAHPAIARVIDAGRADDRRLFVVSELVDGRPLDRCCDEELFTIERRLELFAEVCAAVQYAHRKLVVHGGLEPASVVVTANGEIKLLDFGMASLMAPLDASAGVTPVPSPTYASPEHVRGEPLVVASDVYQLGLLLYRLLTGEHAQMIGSSDPAAVRNVVCAALPDPPSRRITSVSTKTAALRRVPQSTLARKLRGDLDEIVMYALRKEPDGRYPSVSLLRSDVQRWAAHLPVWARRSTPFYRIQKFIERRRAPVAAATVIVLAGAATLPGPMVERLRASRETARVVEVEGPNAPEYIDQTARLKDTLALRRATFGDDSLEVAATLEILGQNQHAIGRFDEAETNLRTAVAVRQVRLGGRHPDTLSATIALGDLLYARGQFLEAEQMLRGVVGTLRPESVNAAADAPVSDLLPRALRELANVLRDRGAVGESAALYREAIDMLRQPGRETGSELALTRVDLARGLTVRAELDRADTELADALPALRRAHGGDHPLVGMTLSDYGALRIAQGRFDEAQNLLAEAQRIQEKWLGRVHPASPRTRGLLAELERRRGRLPEAVSLSVEVLNEFDRLGLTDHPWTIDIRATLAEALLGLGQNEQAARALAPAMATAKRLLVSYDMKTARLQDLMRRAARGLPASAFSVQPF